MIQYRESNFQVGFNIEIAMGSTHKAVALKSATTLKADI